MLNVMCDIVCTTTGELGRRLIHHVTVVLLIVIVYLTLKSVITALIIILNA